MPTYAYACKDCDHAFDIQQSFSDNSLTVCPECKGSLRKKFNSVGVVFKGPGFYRTDSRESKGKTTAPAKDGSGKPTPAAVGAGKRSESSGESSSSDSSSGSSSGGSSPGKSSPGKSSPDGSSSHGSSSSGPSSTRSSSGPAGAGPSKAAAATR